VYSSAYELDGDAAAVGVAGDAQWAGELALGVEVVEQQVQVLHLAETGGDEVAGAVAVAAEVGQDDAAAGVGQGLGDALHEVGAADFAGPAVDQKHGGLGGLTGGGMLDPVGGGDGRGPGHVERGHGVVTLR